VAMGATSARVLSLILAEGGRLGGLGLTIGLVGALGLAPLLQALVPDLNAFDPAAFVISALVVTVVSAAAIIGPAWRASQITPAVALRSN
jgi:putative ABC transport system permease protein